MFIIIALEVFIIRVNLDVQSDITTTHYIRNATFPLPHVFGLRRLRNAIRLVRFGYNSSTGRVVLRVAPIPPFPLCTSFEGTHGVRSAWGNTDAIDFVAIASSLQATNGIQGVCNTNRLKAVPLVHGRKNLHSLVHLYKASRSTLASSPPLRLAFHLRKYFYYSKNLRCRSNISSMCFMYSIGSL